MEFKTKIREFIEANLVVFEDEAIFSDEDNIFQMGYVNSLFAMKLLNYVEKEFDIRVENEEMDIKNFSSVDRIVALIHRKQSTLSNK